MNTKPEPLVQSELLAANDLLPPTEALSRQFVLEPEDAERGPETAGAESARRRRGFRIGTIGLVPEAGTLCEILERPRIYPIPNTADCCLGMINLRGTLIPAFEVHAAFGAGADDGPGRWVIAIGNGAEAGALCIDGLPEQVELSTDSRIATIPPLPGSLHPHVLGGYQCGGVLWFEFDHAGLFRAIAER